VTRAYFSSTAPVMGKSCCSVALAIAGPTARAGPQQRLWRQPRDVVAGDASHRLHEVTPLEIYDQRSIEGEHPTRQREPR
jgi:hypothetical protein